MDLGGWLRSLGLERYEAAFRANAIDADVLCDLTDQDLEKLGVLLGHRRKLLRAIGALDDALAPATAPRATPSPNARDQSSAAGASETHFKAPATDECVHVTVMFCGLVDSNGSSPSPDAVDWRGLVGAYLHAASTAVTEWNGTVAEKLDDGLIALFAYPVMQENDLERAVHAARVIQRSVAELNRRNGSKRGLAARIVIESGPTVIDGDSDIFGELRNVVAGAQAVAEPNASTITQQRQISAAEEQDSRTNKGSPEIARSWALSDGRLLSYYQLIARAVDGLDKNTGEARRALYERARNALVAQLRSNQPVLVLADITKERLALEEAIRKVEAEAARKSRTELRTEKQDLRSVAPVGARDVDGRSVPPWRDRPNASSTHLPGDEWSPVLFSARNRLLNTRPSTIKPAVNPLRDMVSDVQEVGPAAAKAARQKIDASVPETLRHQPVEEPVQFSGEAHADLNDLNSNDDDTQQQRGHRSAYEAESDSLLPRYTRSALEMQNDPRRWHQVSSPRPSSLPRANLSLSLPSPLVVSGMIVATLNDARVLIERHLQGDSRAKEMWTYVSNELRRAALGGDMAEFSSVLEMAFSLEGLEWALQ
jgi:class 3 adenylate cyclase